MTMTPLLGPARDMINVIAKSIGKFGVEMRANAEEDHHNLSSLGLFINTVVVSCTFRPPATASELRLECEVLKFENAQLGDNRFADIDRTRFNDLLDRENDGSPREAFIEKGLLYEAKVAELKRHQDAFNPVGGLVVGSVLIFTSLTLMTLISNNFIPYSLRENSKFVAKCIHGGAAGMLTKEAVEGWARHTDGTVRTVRPACD